jgi:hypothetical protein
MGKLRLLLVIIAFFIVAFAVGQQWKLKPETAANHVVRANEIAVVVNGNDATVWLCANKEDAYEMQKAMTAGDVASLQQAAGRKAAFPVAAGVRVKVLTASVDKRHVQIVEGPQEGKTGWLEFEYLRPARAQERRGL